MTKNTYLTYLCSILIITSTGIIPVKLLIHYSLNTSHNILDGFYLSRHTIKYHLIVLNVYKTYDTYMYMNSSTHNSMYNQIEMKYTSLDIVTSSMGILFLNGLGYDMLARPDIYTST